MSRYNVSTPRGKYELAADTKDDLRQEILNHEKITFKKIQEDYEPSDAGFIYLEQDDSKWDKVTIGNTPYTVGRWGCLITSLSMLTFWYGKYINPGELAKKLEFNSNGEILWRSINEACPFDFVYRYYNRDIDKIKNIIYSADNSCVIRVPYGKYYHWLTAVSSDEAGVVAADPIDGSRCYPEKKYGWINGFAEVKRK